MNDYKDVLDYFSKKASSYDLVDSQIYWKLSDKLLWHSLQKYALENANVVSFNILDAGGGTGRWTKLIIENYANATVTLYDLSSDMLAVAKNKLDCYRERVCFKQGDISSMNCENDSFDICINFHNVLGFVENPSFCIKEMSRVVKKGGLVISFIPNLYHLIYFNIKIGNIEEAKAALLNEKGRFTTDMPSMHLFTPKKIEEIYVSNGLTPIITTGFPNIIYPDIEETTIKDSSTSLVKILDDESRFLTIYEIEKNLLEFGDISSRGNNIFIVGKKI